MAEAKRLKDESEPEHQEKSARIKQLRDLRQTTVSRIMDIKANVQGLDVRSEADLEAKIKELEAKQAHGVRARGAAAGSCACARACSLAAARSAQRAWAQRRCLGTCAPQDLTLREEKQVVAQISKLAAQRGKLKEYDVSKLPLPELEAEASKVRAPAGRCSGRGCVCAAPGVRAPAARVMSLQGRNSRRRGRGTPCARALHTAHRTTRRTARLAACSTACCAPPRRSRRCWRTWRASSASSGRSATRPAASCRTCTPSCRCAHVCILSLSAWA